MSNLSLVFVVIAVIFVANNAAHSRQLQQIEDGTPLTCSNSNRQFLPNPESCTSFIHCSNGQPFLKECPAGLHWDERWSTCNWSKDTKCNVEGGNSTQNPNPNPSPNPDPLPETTTTTITTTGTPIDDRQETEKLETTTTTRTITTPANTPHPPLTKRTTTTATTTTTTRPDTGETLPCPSISNDLDYFYVTHPNFCNKFYLCRRGSFKGIHPCGQNLHFSSSLQACVKPEKSDCTTRG